jgi:hypothetical protein
MITSVVGGGIGIQMYWEMFEMYQTLFIDGFKMHLDECEI